MKQKFVSYLRVSTGAQGRSGLGLDAQRTAVAAFVSAAGTGLVGEYVEVESGRKSDRPKLDAAISACRLHKATLVVAKLDRLSRDAHFLLGLKDSGVEFVCCDMPSANRLTVGIMAIVAEEEARLISARTREALQAAKARGVRLGTPNLTEAARRLGTSRSAQVRAMKATRLAQDLRVELKRLSAIGIDSPSEVAASLNDAKIPASRGGRWSCTQVQRLTARLVIELYAT